MSIDLEKLISLDASLLLMKIRDVIDSHLALSIAKQKETENVLAMELDLLLQLFCKKTKIDDLEVFRDSSTQHEKILNNLCNIVARIETELKDLKNSATIDSFSSEKGGELIDDKTICLVPGEKSNARAIHAETLIHDDKDSERYLRIQKIEPIQSEKPHSHESSRSHLEQSRELTSSLPNCLADTFAKPTVRNEAVSMAKGADTVMRLSAISSIKKGMTINDRKLFRIELCEGNEEIFREMIDEIDHSSTLEDAIAVLHKFYHGEADNLVLQQFIELIERRFVNG